MKQQPPRQDGVPHEPWGLATQAYEQLGAFALPGHPWDLGPCGS